MPRGRSHQPLTVRAIPPGDEYVIKWYCQMFGLCSISDRWIGRTCGMIMTVEDKSTQWTTGDEVCGYIVLDVPFDYWRLLSVQSYAWEPKTCFHNSETKRYVMKRHAMTISDLWSYQTAGITDFQQQLASLYHTTTFDTERQLSEVWNC